MVERSQKRKGGDGGHKDELELKDLSGEIPAIQDVLDKIGEVVKKKVEPPPKSDEDEGCCGNLVRDCCS